MLTVGVQELQVSAQIQLGDGITRAELCAAGDAHGIHHEVDADRCAGMGYCFGGLCMLDLARSGADVAGVISIHGLFNAPDIDCAPIAAKVLCLHGYDDPMALPETILELGSELSSAGADWQLHAYGGTVHAFTNPEANDPDFGTVYSATADARATQAIDNFLAEIFAG